MVASAAGGDPRPVLHLTVGLPGSGKTTAARAIAERERIVRLTPDEWMAPLFGESDAGGRRDILEGRMIDTALQVVRGGSGAILDFGCWSPEERWAIRALAEACGGRCVLVVTDVDEAERRRRAHRRWLDAPETTFEMTEDDHDRFLVGYTPPGRDELDGSPVPPCPEGFTCWGQWAARRWPTLPEIPTRS